MFGYKGAVVRDWACAVCIAHAVYIFKKTRKRISVRTLQEYDNC